MFVFPLDKSPFSTEAEQCQRLDINKELNTTDNNTVNNPVFNQVSDQVHLYTTADNCFKS